VKPLLESGTERFIRSTAQEVPEECTQDDAQRGSHRGTLPDRREGHPARTLSVETGTGYGRSGDRVLFRHHGEGSRLAQILRVKRKEIKKDEPIRCVIDTANDPPRKSASTRMSRARICIQPISSKFQEAGRETRVGGGEIAAVRL